MHEFLLRLQSFFEGVATSEDEPGPLKRACELYFELDKMTSPFKSSDSDAQQPEPAAVGAAGRLRASIAPAATAWIGSLMQTMSVEEVPSPRSLQRLLQRPCPQPSALGSLLES